MYAPLLHPAHLRAGGGRTCFLKANRWVLLAVFSLETPDYLQLQRTLREQEAVDYPFSVAAGYSNLGQSPLLEAQKRADENMYADKMRKKAGRL